MRQPSHPSQQHGCAVNPINQIINDAATQNGLKIYVVNPTPVHKFYGSMRSSDPIARELGRLKKDREAIMNQLSGYFPYLLKDMLRGATATRDYASLTDSFFGEADIDAAKGDFQP